MSESTKSLLNGGLDVIEQRAKKATPGPWETDTEYSHSRTDVCLVLLDAQGKRLSDTLNADDQTINEECDDDGVSFYVSGTCVDALEFAAAARTDIPALCDALKELANQYSELVDALCSPSWLGRERHESVIGLAKRLRDKQGKLYAAETSDGSRVDCLGTCETPHFLGELTADRKALMQVPHYPLPQNQCRNWMPLPSPPQEAKDEQ